ncbi:MAG: BaiN/RdsA family NAD(P)/FAD-dependent oxidoreductase [Symbiobacteriia bacterium]
MPPTAVAPNPPTVLIIGGGAAGLLAAIAAAEHGARVTLLERNPEPGIKVLMSGGGRCNVTNTGDVPHLVASFPGNGRFLYSAFATFGNDEVVGLLAQEGIGTHVEDRGRVFPNSGQARDVVGALLRRAQRLGVTALTNRRVTSVSRGRGSGFIVRGKSVSGRGRSAHEVGQEQTWTADRLIICTGGVSYPSSGSTGDGYSWARQFGHRVVPPQPAIVALETREAWPARVRGVALQDVALEVRAGGRSRGSFRGDILFTHFGLSGPAALNASHQAVLAAAAAQPGVRVELAIRLEPDTPMAAWDERLQDAARAHPRQLLRNILSQWWPASLAEVLQDRAGVPQEREAAHLTRPEREALARLLHELVLTLKKPRPIAEAMVTAGGVDVREVNPKTMASRLVPGLYFAGEVLDVDGISGGYNLQAAYSTGWLAGRSAAVE